MTIELPDCSRAFVEIEEQRTGLLSELTAWPANRLSFRPGPGAWSAVEVIDHIVRAEAGTIAGVRAGLRHPHTLGPEERPGIAALDRALRSDQSFQVPVGAEMIHPDSHTTLPEVAARWDQARLQLKSLIEGLAPGDARCGVFCHPFAGWMTIADVLDHFSAHIYHHRFQLARLRATAGNLQS